MAFPINTHCNELLTSTSSNTGFTDGPKARLMTTDRVTTLLGCRTERSLMGRVKSILKPSHLQQPKTLMPRQVSSARPLQQPQATGLLGLIWPDNLKKHHAAPRGMIWSDRLQQHHATATPSVITPKESRSRKQWSDVKPTTLGAITLGFPQQTNLSISRMTWSAVRPMTGNAISRAFGLTSQYFTPPTDAKTSDLPTSRPRKKWNNSTPLTSSALSTAMGLTSQSLRQTTEGKATDLQRLRTLVKAHTDTAKGKPMMQGEALTSRATGIEIGFVLEVLMQVANDVATHHSHRGSIEQQRQIKAQLRAGLQKLTFGQQQRLLSTLEGEKGEGLKAIGRFARHQLTLSDTGAEMQEVLNLSRLARNTELVDGLTQALRDELHITRARFDATKVRVNDLSQLAPNELKAMVQWLANQKHVAS